jgi:hypothetical protein
MNITSTTAPASQQLNADDLIGGPRTIRITTVTAGTPDQPVNVGFDGDNGRSWKPGKSMRRVLLALYGAESSAYIGKRVTLFNDPEITFGPDKTGGIRVSHASGIESAMTIALTVKKGKRKPFTVNPLPSYSSELESLRNAAQTGTKALTAAFLALPKDAQEFLRPDAGELKAVAAANDKTSNAA